ncbi:WD40 repeat domain-containing protein, partial [Candidatus Dependentiae bacterium]
MQLPPLGERISWSPDGNFLAIGWVETAEHGVRIYEFDDTDGAESLTLRDTASPKSHGATVYFVEWSPDGFYLLEGGDPSSSGSYEVRVYSFDSTAKTLTELTGCRVNLATCDRVMHGTWHPSGDFVAIGAVNDDVINIYHFDGTNLTLSYSKDVSGLEPTHLSWSPDGIFLSHSATAGSDNLRVYKFNGESLEEMSRGTKDLGGSNVYGAVFSSNGKFLSVCCDNSSNYVTAYPVVKESLLQANSDFIQTYYNLPNSNESDITDLESRLTTVESLIDDNAEAAGSVDALEAYLDPEDTNITTLHTDIGNAEPDIVTNSNSVVSRQGSLYADSSAIVELDLRLIASSNALIPNSWAITDISGLNEPFTLAPAPAEYPRDVVWSPDGKYCAIAIYSGSDTDRLRVYKRDGNDIVFVTDTDHGAEMASVDWNGSGDYIAISGNAGTGSKTVVVYSFDGYALTEVGSSTAGSATIWKVGWHPNGNFLSFADNVGGVYIASFDTSTGTLGTAASQVSYGDSVRGLAWSRDGSYLAIGGYTAGGQVRVYSFDSSDSSLTLVDGDSCGDTTSGNGAAWNKDGTVLAVACSGGSFSGFKTFTFNGTALTEVGSVSVGNNNYNIAISSEGNCLSIVSDTDVILYNLAISGAVTAISGASKTTSGTAIGLAFSPDDSLLFVSCSSSVNLYTYPIARISFIEDNSWAVLTINDQIVSDSDAVVTIDAREKADSSAIVSIQADVFPNDYSNPSRIYEN